MSCVMCHVSHVMCHISHNISFFLVHYYRILKKTPFLHFLLIVLFFAVYFFQPIPIYHSQPIQAVSSGISCWPNVTRYNCKSIFSKHTPFLKTYIILNSGTLNSNIQNQGRTITSSFLLKEHVLELYTKY